jgi:hypothetical protein
MPQLSADTIAILRLLLDIGAVSISIFALYTAKRSFWIQALNSLVDNFFTSEILGAERELRNWQHRNKGKFAKEYAEHRLLLAENKLNDPGFAFANLDRGRRLVQSYFYRVHQLKENGPLGDKAIRSYVHDQQVEVLLGILLPIEREITGDREPFHKDVEKMYDYYIREYPEAKKEASKKLKDYGILTDTRKIEDLVRPVHQGEE